MMRYRRPLGPIEASSGINLCPAWSRVSLRTPVLAGFPVAGRDSVVSTSEPPQRGQNRSTGLKIGRSNVEAIRGWLLDEGQFAANGQRRPDTVEACCNMAERMIAGLWAELEVARGLIDESRPVVAWASNAQAMLVECGKWFADDHFCADYPLRHAIEALLAEVEVSSDPERDAEVDALKDEIAFLRKDRDQLLAQAQHAICSLVGEEHFERVSKHEIGDFEACRAERKRFAPRYHFAEIEAVLAVMKRRFPVMPPCGPSRGEIIDEIAAAFGIAKGREPAKTPFEYPTLREVGRDEAARISPGLVAEVEGRL